MVTIHDSQLMIIAFLNCLYVKEEDIQGCVSIIV